MIDIINRWTRAILRHSETADTIGTAVLEAYAGGADLRDADLSGADLRDADLRDADLSGAVLSGAVLSGAVLSGAKQYICRIQGSRHEINAIDDDVMVGCQRHRLSYWMDHYAGIGKMAGYTPDQIAEYGLHLKHIAAVLQVRQAVG